MVDRDNVYYPPFLIAPTVCFLSGLESAKYWLVVMSHTDTSLKRADGAKATAIGVATAARIKVLWIFMVRKNLDDNGLYFFSGFGNDLTVRSVFVMRG